MRPYFEALNKVQWRWLVLNVDREYPSPCRLTGGFKMVVDASHGFHANS
jgi:hypothetical protein